MAKTTSKSNLGLKKSSTLKLSDEEIATCIKKKAHELWEQKGRIQGQDLEIWLEAEKIVKSGMA